MKSFHIILFFALAIVTSGYNVSAEHATEINWNAGSCLLFCFILSLNLFLFLLLYISHYHEEGSRAPNEHVRSKYVRKAKAEKKKPKKPNAESTPAVQPKPITLSEALLRPDEIELSSKEKESN
jgi:hypothetical protein